VKIKILISNVLKKKWAIEFQSETLVTTFDDRVLVKITFIILINKKKKNINKKNTTMCNKYNI
jgi:hypothetical protein